MRASDEGNSPPGYANLHYVGSGGGEKNIEKEEPKLSPSLLWPTLMSAECSPRMYSPLLVK